MIRREVRVSEQFFARLDELLPAERSADGRPSAADFLLHELPDVVDELADDFVGATLPSGYDEEIRVLVANGLLVKAFVVYAALDGADVVDVFYLDIDR